MDNNSLSNILNMKGIEKIISFIELSYKSNNYYTPEEIIDISINNNFYIDSPFVKIKKGTIIEENCSITNNSIIEGNNIVIKKNSTLNNALIYGSNIIIGDTNAISGEILIDNISTGKKNILHNLTGLNNGTIFLGSNNKLSNINFYNPANQKIIIGNNNWLHHGLNLNCSFDKGGIYIGNNNNLGKDGGGVITTAYQYNKGWWGYVLIGSNVQTTRGSEILGCSMLGWPISNEEKELIQEIFINGPIEKVFKFFETKFNEGFNYDNTEQCINIYGVVKVKMCCLSGNVTVRDDTRIQSSFLKGVTVPERNKIYFSTIDNSSSKQLDILFQDKAVEKVKTSIDIDWGNLPVQAKTNGYRDSDAIFFAGTGKANLLNMSY